MISERRKYTEEFKREVVQLMASSGKPIAALARELGINDNNLYRRPSVSRNRPSGVSVLPASGGIRRQGD